MSDLYTGLAIAALWAVLSVRIGFWRGGGLLEVKR
jgi:hypothetical protein